MLEFRTMRLCLAAVFLVTSLAAQTTPEVEITAEPHHHLVLQNAYVRVFREELAPGATTLLHRHRHDYVATALGAAQISNQVEGKSPVTTTLQDGQTVFFQGGMAHAMRNVGTTLFRNITVEFLPPAKTRPTPPPKWDEERGLDILQGGTKDILFVQDGVRVSQIDLQPGGMIPRLSRAGPQLLIAVTDLELHDEDAGNASSMMTLHSGDVKWLPAGIVHTMMNMSKGKAKLISLEFH